MIKYCKYCFIYLILFKLVNNTLIRSNDVYKKVVKSVYDYYHCMSIILIFLSHYDSQNLDTETVTRIIDIQLFFIRKFQIPTTTIDLRRFPLHISENVSKMTNPLFIVLNDSDEIRSQLVATVFTKSVDVSHGTWLIFAEEKMNINKFVENFDIPVNCKFMVSKKHVNKTECELITEVYYLGDSQELKLQTFGIWDSSDGLIPPKLSIFQRRKNLQGLKLRAVATTPVIFETPKSIFSKHIVFMRIFNLLSEIMNFTKKINFISKTGHFESSYNGSGIIALLFNKSADISITPMFIGKEKLKLIDSTMAFTSARLYLYINNSNKIIHWTEFLKPFNKIIWILIIIVIMSSSILYFFMEMVCDANDELKSWARLKPKPPGFLHCVFKIFGLICGKESGTSRSTSIRTVQVTIQIASVLLLTAYSAQLIQNLTNGSNIDIPFDSVDDFLKDKTYRLALPSQSDHFYHFSNSPIKLETQIAKKISKEMNSLPQSEVEGFQNLCNMNKYAFLSFRGILRRYNPPEGCIIMAVGLVLKDFYVMGLQKRSPYKEMLNIQMHRSTEYGLRSKYFGEVKFLELNGNKLKKDWIPVELFHVCPLIIFLMLFMCLSLIILCGEIKIYRHRKKMTQINALRQWNVIMRRNRKNLRSKEFHEIV